MPQKQTGKKNKTNQPPKQSWHFLNLWPPRCVSGAPTKVEAKRVRQKAPKHSTADLEKQNPNYTILLAKKYKIIDDHSIKQTKFI